MLIKVDLPAPLGPSKAKKVTWCDVQTDPFEGLRTIAIGLVQVIHV